MYHLLLVDDEDITLNRLRGTINWAALGIGEVSVAYSLVQAQRSYRAQRIDIMICDIEMPAGSGMELLKWVRENGYDTINIFLTAHADFEYVREALSMQTLEYILKPISFEEVERAVLKAVSQADSARMQRRRERYIFFKSLLGSDNFDAAYRSAQGYGISLPEEAPILPIVLHHKHHFKLAEGDGYPRVEAAIREAAKDFAPLLCDPIRLSGGCVLLLDGSRLAPSALFEECQRLCALVREKTGLAVLACFDGPFALRSLTERLKEMLQSCHATTIEQGVVQMRDSVREAAAGQFAGADFALCEAFLGRGLCQKANEYVQSRLMSLSYCDQAFLDTFQRNYWQMVRQLLNSQDGAQGMPKDLRPAFTLNSLSALLQWCVRVNNTVAAMLSAESNPPNAVEQAKQYIQAHVYSAIKRNQIALSVHMSEEYLSRIFKKEVGKSLVEYITDVKLDAAKKLLSHTDLPISEISIQLGYENFAYFSQLFRSCFHMTPSAYRKRARENVPD